ncbi:zinc finger protein 384-like isoform X4 [Scleropages formosus]|uniref:zinc finger protein 384-like isoform X3 n=1 Tax=Scleropages formosus TaxID=113540 RepID=UPI0010FAC3DC|nr:zinc finger protein 384 isoform X3 [Scleropages formosus]XP_029116006.1 zinc finger protein 384 isoform X4 [Scleropages formosus]
MMEDSHFNSSYFWSPVPTVQGQSWQIENAMFLNKMKEQLGPEKNPSFPHSSSHYPTAVLTVPGPVAMDAGGRAPKQEGGGGTSLAVGSHLHPPHTTQNITVVPVPSTGIMAAAGLVITTPQGTLVSPPSSSQSFVSAHPTTTMIVSTLHAPNSDKKEEVSISPAVVMPTPSKRGRKKKSVLPRAGPAAGGHPLSTGSDALILAHLAAGGQHHTADPYDLSNDEEDHGNKDGSKSYRCRMCAVTFFSKSDMQIHAKSHTEAKPHKCPHCSKSFANSSYLAQHIRIHTGVKPYTCSYCQKSFRQLSHLQQHNRIHTGDRPYKCVHPGCEKAFTQLSNLQSHRRQHNKDKPFKCHNCNRGYTDSASLEVHLSTHTVKHAKLFSCGLCNRTYTSETYLMKHMRKHNPDPLTAATVVAAQQSQQNQSQAGTAGGQSRGERESGSATGGGGGASSGQSQNPSSYPQTEGVPCPFDLHQYKTVSAGDIQYKPVSVTDLTAHKDLCLTVSTSAIQVEHLNS